VINKKWSVILISSIVLSGAIFALTNNQKKDGGFKGHILEYGESVESTIGLESVVKYKATRIPGVLTNNLKLEPSQQAAISILVNSDRYTTVVVPALSQKHIIEIFGIYPTTDCVDCQRIELYNFTDHGSVIAVVNQTNLVSLETYKDLQPDIPKHLINIANDIAKANPKTEHELEEYGVSTTTDTMMANTKTTMNNTRCERQRHLCVAPTFPGKNGALWTIVDLTDLYMTAVAWTDYPDDYKSDPLTLQKIEQDTVKSQFCDKKTSFNQSGWSGNYQLTSSDGLAITDLAYGGKLVADSIKLVDWHVSYSGRAGFGYADAVGCPIFSQAAVVAATAPRIETRDNGFELLQEFWSDGWPGPCNYFYTQRLQLENNGSFRVIAESDGRGCGNDATYRPIIRIKLSSSQSGLGIDREKWWYAKDQETLTSADYKVVSDPADNALLYVSEGKNKNEGDSELPTIGSCCSDSYKQGPDQFTDNEQLSGESSVLWYVGQMKNDDKIGSERCWARTIIDESGKRQNQIYPCSSGPYFQRKI
jgi:hypothetical protein